MFTALYATRGYLPEMEPQEFDNIDDAQEFLISELKLHHDQDTQQFNGELSPCEVQQLKNAENACMDAIKGIIENSCGAYGSYVYEIVKG